MSTSIVCPPSKWADRHEVSEVFNVNVHCTAGLLWLSAGMGPLTAARLGWLTAWIHNNVLYAENCKNTNISMFTFFLFTTPSAAVSDGELAGRHAHLGLPRWS